MKKAFFLIFLSIGIISGITAQPITNGLIGYWSMDNGSGADQTGTFQSSSIVGGVTATTDRFGNSTGALNFDGTGYINITDVSSLRTSDQSFSISYWVNMADNADYYRRHWYLGNRDSFDGTHWLIMQKFRSGYDAGRITIGSKGAPNIQTTSLQPGSGLINQWLHVVGIYDYTDPLNPKGRLYINGDLQEENSIYNYDLNAVPTLIMRIGQAATVPSEHMHVGAMDDFMLFDRVLSLTEIEELRDAPAPSANYATETSWKNDSGISISGSSVTKTATTSAWDAGTISVNALNAGVNGWVEAEIAAYGESGMLGLSLDNTDQNYMETDYAIYYNSPGNIRIYEDGMYEGEYGSYAAGDVIKVERFGSEIRYWHNGIIIKTTSTVPAFVLHADINLNTEGSSMTNIQFSDSFTTPVEEPNSSTISWSNLNANLKTSGNYIWRTSGAEGWTNGGALTSLSLNPNTDGYIEATVFSRGFTKMFGLSANNAIDTYESIDYAFLTNEAGELKIFEKGYSDQVSYSFQDGDVLRIERVGSNIEFRQNGNLIRSVETNPYFQLHGDVALKEQGAGLSVSLSSTFNAVTSNPANSPTDNWLNVTSGIGIQGKDIWCNVESSVWEEGLISESIIPGDQNGFVEVTAAGAKKARMFGLSAMNNIASYTSINHAIDLNAGYVRIFENGNQIGGNYPNYSNGDIFRVERDGSTINYIKNGDIFATGTVDPSIELHADFAFRLQSSMFENVTMGTIGLIGHYQLDGNAVNEISGFEPGTVNGNPTATYGIEGTEGTALQFNGSTDYISLGTANGLDEFEELTLSAWIKASTPSELKTIISKGGNSGANHFNFAVETTGKLNFWFNQAGSHVANGQKIVTDGTWHHVVAVWNGSQNLLYVDGELDATVNNAPTITSSSNPMRIGKWGGSNTLYLFEGAIDDVKIYNKALSASDISNMYNAVNFEIPSDLAAHYPMDGDATDVSENSLNGSITGTTATTGQDGTSNGALSFNGTSDYIDIDVATTTLSTMSEGTFTAWVRPVNATGPQGQIITFGDDDSGNYIVVARTPEGKLGFTSVLNGSFQFRKVTTNQVFTDNVWKHIAVTQDGSAPLVYIDGVSVPIEDFSAGANLGAWFSDFGGTLDRGRIGSIHYNSSNDQIFFEGDIDEVNIYRKALSVEEIQSVMAGNNSVPSNSTLWTQSGNDVTYTDGRVFIGNSTYNSTDYNLFVEKGILTERVKVQLTTEWADYVFEDDYVLIPIEELEAFLKKEKHLPNVPSAKEVAEQGIDVEEMNIKLLEKIEELTLYIINQQKEIGDLNSKMVEQQKLLEQLQQLVNPDK